MFLACTPMHMQFECISDLLISYWWHIELPYWFKASFCPEIIGISTTQYAKYNFMNDT